MKVIVKIIAVIIILNAASQVALASWRHFQLRDAAEQAVTFGAGQDPAAIKGGILRRAAELNLPVSEANVTVVRNGKYTSANASYTQAIELFPTYTYPYDFSFKVESTLLAGLK
jgi:hypothetical protein